jgi:uncharacterized protein (DUF2336 family)
MSEERANKKKEVQVRDENQCANKLLTIAELTNGHCVKILVILVNLCQIHSIEARLSLEGTDAEQTLKGCRDVSERGRLRKGCEMKSRMQGRE